MALINEHIVKEEILKVVGQLLDEYCFEYYPSGIMDFSKEIIDKEDFNNILTDLSQELTKILK